MQPVTLTVHIDRAAAILAGKSSFGPVTVPVDPAALTELQRAELVALGESAKLLPACNPDKAARYQCDVGYVTPLVEPTPDAIARALSESAGRRVEQRGYEAAAKAAKASEERARSIEAVQEWLAKPEIDHRGESSLWAGHVERLPADWRQRYDSALANAKAAWVARRAKYQEEQKAREAREVAESERRKAALNDWVSLHGSELHKVRRKRGLMPDDEVLSLVREQVFGPYSEFARYERMTAREVFAEVEDAEFFDSSVIGFATEPAESVTDVQLTQLVRIEAAVPTARVDVRTHLGKYNGATMLKRTSALVTIDWHGHKLSREFALLDSDQLARL